MNDLIQALGRPAERQGALETVLSSPALREGVRRHLVETVGLLRLRWVGLEWAAVALAVRGDDVLLQGLYEVGLVTVHCAEGSPVPSPDDWSRLSGLRGLRVSRAQLGPNTFRDRTPAILELLSCAYDEGLVLGPGCTQLRVREGPPVQLPSGLRGLRLSHTGTRRLSIHQPHLKELEVHEPSLDVLEVRANRMTQCTLKAPLRQLSLRADRLAQLVVTGAQVADLDWLPPALQSLDAQLPSLAVVQVDHPALKTLSVRPAVTAVVSVGDLRELDLRDNPGLTALPDLGDDPPAIALKGTGVPRTQRWRCSWAASPSLAALSRKPRPKARTAAPANLRKPLARLRRLVADKSLESVEQALELLRVLDDPALAQELLKGLRLTRAHELRHRSIQGPHAEHLVLELLALVPDHSVFRARRLQGTVAMGADWPAVRPLDFRRLGRFQALAALQNDGHTPVGDGPGVRLPRLRTLRQEHGTPDWLEGAPALRSLTLGGGPGVLDLGRFPKLDHLCLEAGWDLASLAALNIRWLELRGAPVSLQPLLEMKALRTLTLPAAIQRDPLAQRVLARIQSRS